MEPITRSQIAFIDPTSRGVYTLRHWSSCRRPSLKKKTIYCLSIKRHETPPWLQAAAAARRSLAVRSRLLCSSLRKEKLVFFTKITHNNEKKSYYFCRLFPRRVRATLFVRFFINSFCTRTLGVERTMLETLWIVALTTCRSFVK